MDDTIEYMIYYIYISLWYYFQEYKIDYSIFFYQEYVYYIE